jgi:hypothetical protein
MWKRGSSAMKKHLTLAIIVYLCSLFAVAVGFFFLGNYTQDHVIRDSRKNLATLYVIQGISERSRNNDEKAKIYFITSIELNPQQCDAYLYMASIYEKQYPSMALDMLAKAKTRCSEESYPRRIDDWSKELSDKIDHQE